MTINLADHMMSLKGKAYLPVAPRIVAFREEHPDWSIQTEPVEFRDTALCRAIVLDADGRIIATSFKTVTAFAGGSFEKAETGAIGRALSLCGYGTLAAMDHDEGDDIAEAPVTVPHPPEPVQRPPTKAETEAVNKITAATSPAELEEVAAWLAKQAEQTRKSNHVRSAYLIMKTELAAKPAAADPVESALAQIAACRTLDELATVNRRLQGIPTVATDQRVGFALAEARDILDIVAKEAQA